MQEQQEISLPNFNLAPKKSKIVKSVKHMNDLCDKHLSFLEKHELSDICIIASNNVEFHAHKNVLSAGSDFFLTMFGGDLMESKASEVKIHEVMGDILKLILVFIYTGTIDLQTDTVEDILRAANFFQIKALIKECYNFMGEEMDSSNCLGIALFADQHDLKELYEKATQFVCMNFEKVANNDEFLDLTGDQIDMIISNKNLYVASEETLFLSLMKWMEHDNLNRENYAFKLFSHVRYWLLSPYFIKQHQKKLCKAAECWNMICDWLQWHLSPDSSGLESRELSKDKLIVIVKNQMHTYNPKLNTWVSETLPGFPLSFDKILETNKKLIVKVDNSLQCYDLHSNELSNLPQLDIPRTGFGIGILNHELYIVGGYTPNPVSWKRHVEKFNFSLNKWQAVAPMNNRPLSNPIVAVAGGFLYVSNKEYGTIDCFNPHSNEWTFKYGPPNSPNLNYCFTNINEKLVIVGGQLSNNQISKSVSILCNGSTANWNIYQMRLALSRPKCASWNNRLIICGGYDDTNTLLNFIQEYNPDLKKWRTLASLDHLNDDNYDIINIPNGNTDVAMNGT
ncbi:kelch-like protein 28 [Episyrphus balteatus]|uniref:kelch-like protein 28 n=1 Tax=Episyrphus balteatus TaxID=286459 RepID=UPI0024868763|nr:kelch-like protein 28 [Episyrphus balteatus]